MTNGESTKLPLADPCLRRRWLLSLPLLLLGMIGLGIWLSHLESRLAFIGPTDPATGSHYAFTVAPGWASVPPIAELADDYFFVQAKPPPIFTWLEEHLRYQTSASKPVRIANYLNIRSLIGHDVNTYPIQKGYPTVGPGEQTTHIETEILEQQHLLILGHPATWSVSRSTNAEQLIRGTSNDQNEFYTYMLVINARDKRLMYVISGYSDEAHRNQVRKEVEAIGNSFRIEQGGIK